MGLETWGCPGFGGFAWEHRGPGICRLAPPRPSSARSSLGGLGAPPASSARSSQAGRCVSGTAGIRSLAPACARGTIGWVGRRSGGRRPTGGSSAGCSGVVPAASVVTHILHAHAAPDAQHETLDVALVGAAHDAEVAPLAPGWTPRVGRSLGMRSVNKQDNGSGARRSIGLGEGDRG